MIFLFLSAFSLAKTFIFGVFLLFFILQMYDILFYFLSFCRIGLMVHSSYIKMPLIGFNRSCISSSSIISCRSTAMLLHMADMGTSVTAFSKGFSLKSPTCSIELKIHATTRQTGKISQGTVGVSSTIWEISPKGRMNINTSTNNRLNTAYCLGKG